MASSAYACGRRFEYRVRDHFRALGYLVSRSPQSRSPFDLIVVGHQVVMLVQCKVGGALAPAGWNDLYDLAASVSAVPVLVTREKRKIRCYQMTDRKKGDRTQPRALFTVGRNEATEWQREMEWTPHRRAAVEERAQTG